jgi:DNA-binding CsgD family transcriptional regulator
MSSYNTPKLTDPKAQSKRESANTQMGTKNADHPKVARLREIVPFDQYIIAGIDYPDLGVGSGAILASDVPEAYLIAYRDFDLRFRDPLLASVTPQQSWASEHDISPAQRQAPQYDLINSLLKTHGIGTRSIAVLFRGDTAFAATAFMRETPFDARERFILETSGYAIHAELSADYIANMSVHAGLSVGEVACLRAVAKGLSAENAALETGFTAETVATYIKSATKKLGAANRTHAVAEAIRRKVIS